MSTQTAAIPSKYASTVIAVNSPNEQIQERLQSDIAARAYELYEQTGCSHGEDLGHWLQAESEVCTRVSEVRESSSWFTVNIPVSGFTAADLRISLEPTHALIAAEKDGTSDGGQSASTNSSQRTIFLLVKWPNDVDPTTASAYLQNDTINLTAKRALPASGAEAPHVAETKK